MAYEILLSCLFGCQPIKFSAPQSLTTALAHNSIHIQACLGTVWMGMWDSLRWLGNAMRF